MKTKFFVRNCFVWWAIFIFICKKIEQLNLRFLLTKCCSILLLIKVLESGYIFSCVIVYMYSKVGFTSIIQ